MKKSILMVAVMAILGVATAVAQPRAIGAQLGYGIEFSYEHGLGNNFLSVDAGFPGLFLNHTVGLEGVVTYNWLNPFGKDFPSISKGDWNWYMGVGAGAGAWLHNNAAGVSGYSGKYWQNYSFVGVAGRIGVEYNFWFPLQLSVEWRPIIGPQFYRESYTDNQGNRQHSDLSVSYYTAGLYTGGFSLGVRYKF